ncbi:conserved hypothetical protein [Talaromyces stipitatus ATCC 10500]|uniref:ATP-dependent DNA helicase n=1 Tax=Talaromyces stipitatus (strain ATCC 10500 / CBS 375.48 / QM 6759 / NRRL 1006) TaxID=441959 RepID=B8LVZ0_TALSN|nr:uncharacterized protein TSTA_077230 [Talaromyces stipitatus ATCC 10500]EED24356.1 conserved hypothetical protein [Talaromyces stipitatus ATCC 10500]
MLQLFNNDQCAAFERIVSNLENPSLNYTNFYIQGPGGTGKTFLYHTLYSSKYPRAFADLIVWDEVPMTNRYIFEAVDRTLRDIIKHRDSLFGSILFVLSGDFAQTLLIIIMVPRSQLLQSLKVLTFHQNMWLQGTGINTIFAQWLGRISYDPALQGSIELPAMIPQVVNETELSSGSNPDFLASRAILAVRNVDLKDLSKSLLAVLPGELKTLYSVDKADIDGDSNDGREEFSHKFLQMIEPNRLPPSIFTTQGWGANYVDYKERLCNDTRLVMIGLTKHIIHARILTGDHKGEEILIPYITLESLPTEVPFHLSRCQFPVKLCFSITINKSQGQSLETVDITEPTHALKQSRLLPERSEGGKLV